MDVGLYGKLPTHGDFLRRRVADDFVNVWDPWLQQCIAGSRAALGEPWLETYLTSPVWRFALAAHVCGAAPVAGLLVPSVDRVGRYFPITLVWPTPLELSTLEVALRFQRGFEQAERLILDTLALEHFEFAEFDRHVMDLAVYFENPNPHGALRVTKESAVSLSQSAGRPRCVPLLAATALEAPALQLFGNYLDADGLLGLWWTDGSAAVEPSWLMTPGLPSATNYSAMLDGAWEAGGWDLATTEQAVDATMIRSALGVESQLGDDSMAINSAALTDRGPVRQINQDAFLERADVGLWAVADGMGGLSDGEVASRMVCDALADAPLVATLDEQIDAVVAQLREVNGYLHRMASRATNPVRSGSTVVVAIIRHQQCAMIWAGDSRAYRLRNGVVSQMTVDHSWSAQSGTDDFHATDEQVITRAVGVENVLMPDVVRGDVRLGDRYLLCSDGIARVLDADRLCRILSAKESSPCCAELIAQAVALGSTDNLTALVIDCLPSEPPVASGLFDANL